eukprot:TRINITY_DN12341_c0_g1_i1.p1 TRINITY_DN12341_c0_g1~~TRINITY_DN12341_c0_g1_i1.p1  ORF type:complete len:1353 (+),score=498.83 TRINITY_DN12341_c0_g1_i1:105-4163(+)
MPPQQQKQGPKWLWDQGKGEPQHGVFSGPHFPHKPRAPVVESAARRRIREDDEAVVAEQQARIRRALTAQRPAADGMPRGPVKDAESKAWTLRPRTALEDRELLTAKARQKENMVQKQVVWGREFKGSPFLAAPAEVMFENFEVKREEVRTIKLTNVSFTFNSFKILDLAPQIADFFEITYDRPGRMSAGMCCELTVRFTPKLNEDIDAEIPFMAETGRFGIPLRATTKKVDVSVAVTRELPGGARGLDWGAGRVDFGGVQFAKTTTRTIVVRNSGALAARFDLTGPALARVALAEHRAKGDVAARPLSLRPEKTEGIVVGPHTSIELAFTFAPMRPEDALDPSDSPPRLDLRFSNYVAGLRDFFFTFHGRGVDVPIYVAESCRTIDMHCCYFGTLYREELVLHNRGKTSMRVQPDVPPALKPYLDFVPKFGFIQPADARDTGAAHPRLVFQLKWRPQASTVRECAQYLSTDGQRLSAKLQIQVPDQALPVYWQLCCELTAPRLTLRPSRDGRVRLDFGPLGIGEGASLPLEVHNDALLPVRVGFVSLPKEVSVQPKSLDVPEHWKHPILPQSSETFSVVLRLQSPQPFKEWITLRTERNDDYRILVTGKGKEPPLRLSESVVRMPATAIGDVANVTLLLHNTSRTVQVFEFDLGTDPCGITVSPTCGEVPPGGTEPLLVEFRAVVPPEPPPAEVRRRSSMPEEPQVEIDPESPEGIAKAEAEAAAAKAAATAWRGNHPGTQWSRHRSYQLRCFVKGADQMPLFLEVHQCVVLPALVADLLPTVEPPAQKPKEPAEDPKKGAKPGAKTRAKTPDKAIKPGSAPRASTGESEGRPKKQERQAEEVPPPDPAADPVGFLQWHDTRSAKQIDFGSIPALQPVSRTLIVRNVGAAPAKVTVKPLDPFGPFTVIKPPQPLRPGQICEVTVGFRATTAAVYREELILIGAGANQIIVPMRGTGLTPELAAALGPCALKCDKLPVSVLMPSGQKMPLEVEVTEPVESVAGRLPDGSGGRYSLSHQGQEMSDGELLQLHNVQKDAELVVQKRGRGWATKDYTQTLAVFMGPMIALGELKRHPGQVLTGELRRRTLTLTNRSAFDVPFSISFLSETVEPFNHRGSVPFSCTPSRGTVPANETRDVICHFQADHEFEHFRADAVCEYGGAGCSIRLRFSGSAWHLRLLVASLILQDDVSALFTSLRLPGDGLAAPLQQRAVVEFTPEFATDASLLRPMHHAVFVGNVGKGDGKGAVAGEATFELLDPKDPRSPPKQQLLGFEVSAPGGKLALPPGEEKACVVTFGPKDAGELRERELPVDGVGITVEAILRVTLRGGFPPVPQEKSVITVSLKGNVHIPTAY